MKGSKITIIGSGYVGAAIGYALTYMENIDEIVLIDIRLQASEGEALDINHGISAISTTTVRVGSYEDCRNSDIIIITAGKNRKLGQTRNDLLLSNQEIISDIMEHLKGVYQNSFVILVSNPVDLLTEFIAKQKWIPENQLCGTGCMLDTSRWISEIAKYLGIKNSQITAYAVGEHGIEQYILWSLVKVDGITIEDYCKKEQIVWNDRIKAQLHKIVTDMGEEIIRKKEKTQYGIATVVTYLVNSILSREDRLVSVGTTLGSPNRIVCSRLVYMGKKQIRLADNIVLSEEEQDYLKKWDTKG